MSCIHHPIVCNVNYARSARRTAFSNRAYIIQLLLRPCVRIVQPSAFSFIERDTHHLLQSISTVSSCIHKQCDTHSSRSKSSNCYLHSITELNEGGAVLPEKALHGLREIQASTHQHTSPSRQLPEIRFVLRRYIRGTLHEADLLRLRRHSMDPERRKRQDIGTDRPFRPATYLAHTTWYAPSPRAKVAMEFHRTSEKAQHQHPRRKQHYLPAKKPPETSAASRNTF
jgi:hypothetical protein